MATDMGGLRMQIINNSKYIFCSAAEKKTRADSATKLPDLSSVATLVTPGATTTDACDVDPESLNVVVYGDGTQFTAAVVAGIKPIMEGGSATTPEGAFRKLLLASSELLSSIMPKIGSHQRNIHGGGVVDEDFLSRDLVDKRA